MKTLVIILGETRAHELTFSNFKQNVLDTLNADLCLCIGVKDNYDYDNPFFQAAKHRFVYSEPDDFAHAFDYAANVTAENNFPWREYLKLKNQFMGGILDATDQHPGSAGILIFFRWYLLQRIHLFENNYDRFVITRSDYIYLLPHINLELLDPNYIWVPNSQHYGGYTDRHTVLSRQHLRPYLDILNQFIKSDNYYLKMVAENRTNWNLEKVIKFHLEQHGVFTVKEFPYVMYTVRDKTVTSRWSWGIFDDDLGYYLKYATEFQKAHENKTAADAYTSPHDFYTSFLLTSNISSSMSSSSSNSHTAYKLSYDA